MAKKASGAAKRVDENVRGRVTEIVLRIEYHPDQGMEPEDRVKYVVIPAEEVVRLIVQGTHRYSEYIFDHDLIKQILEEDGKFKGLRRKWNAADPQGSAPDNLPGWTPKKKDGTAAVKPVIYVPVDEITQIAVYQKIEDVKEALNLTQKPCP